MILTFRYQYRTQLMIIYWVVLASMILMCSINHAQIKLNAPHVMIMVALHVLIYREFNLHNVTVLSMNMAAIKGVLPVLINVNKIAVTYWAVYNVLILQEVHHLIVYVRHMKCMETQIAHSAN